MGIQIVTDSTAYLTREEINKYNIKVVQLPVRFQGEERLEGFPGSTFDTYFKALKEAKTFPTTSQPPPAAYAEVYQEAIANGDDVIVLTISSKVSGTYNAALLAAYQEEDGRVSVVDSLTGAANLKHLAIQAQKMVEAGYSKYEIVTYLENQKHKTGVYFTVDTLENLKRSGRLSTTQALIGSVLNVKPIIRLKDGALVSEETVRGKRRARRSLIKAIPKDVKQIYIAHVLNEADASKLKQMIRKKFPDVPIEITVLGPALGSHLGIGTLGLCFIW